MRGHEQTIAPALHTKLQNTDPAVARGEEEAAPGEELGAVRRHLKTYICIEVCV